VALGLVITILIVKYDHDDGYNSSSIDYLTRSCMAENGIWDGDFGVGILAH